MKPNDIVGWLLLAGMLAAGIFLARQFWPVTKETVKVTVRQDSTLARQIAIERDSLKGRLEITERKVTDQERQTDSWKKRAAFYRALADSMTVGDSTMEVPVAVLDTTILSPIDSSGNAYADTVRVKHDFINDLWALRLGLQPRMLYYSVSDTTTLTTIYKVPWTYALPIAALIFLIGFFVRG